MTYFYTPSELAYLREHYANTPNDIIGKVLSRNPRSVAQKARKLGLHKSAEFLAEHGGRFQAGLKPWNKGVPGSTGTQEAWEAFYEFFVRHGFTAEMFPPSVEIDGDYLASGHTSRGTSHMVVMRGGQLLHDPHPSNAGLTAVQVVWLIARKAVGA